MIRWTFAVSGALGRSLRNLFEQLAWRIRQLRCFNTARKLALFMANVCLNGILARKRAILMAIERNQ